MNQKVQDNQVDKKISYKLNNTYKFNWQNLNMHKQNNHRFLFHKGRHNHINITFNLIQSQIQVKHFHNLLNPSLIICLQLETHLLNIFMRLKCSQGINLFNRLQFHKWRLIFFTLAWMGTIILMILVVRNLNKSSFLNKSWGDFVRLNHTTHR